MWSPLPGKKLGKAWIRRSGAGISAALGVPLPWHSSTGGGGKYANAFFFIFFALFQKGLFPLVGCILFAFFRLLMAEMLAFYALEIKA